MLEKYYCSNKMKMLTKEKPVEPEIGDRQIMRKKVTTIKTCC